MRNYRKRKAQGKAQENKTPKASMSTDPTPTSIMCNYNQTNEYFQKNFIGNPVGYACDICDRSWHMDDLKEVKEKHISVLAPEFPDMDVAQFKECVTCTATLDRHEVPSLSSSIGFTYPLFTYSNTNPNLITFLTLILGIKFPQTFFIPLACILILPSNVTKSNQHSAWLS
jgi:hypothetical protein